MVFKIGDKDMDLEDDAAFAQAAQRARMHGYQLQRTAAL